MIEMALQMSSLPANCQLPVYAKLGGNGKTWHLQQAMAATGKSQAQTLLIDDTDDNILVATQQYNHPTTWVSAKKGVRFTDFYNSFYSVKNAGR